MDEALFPFMLPPGGGMGAYQAYAGHGHPPLGHGTDGR